jgi:hypothetical protein
MSIEVPVIILILAIPTYFLSKWVLKKLKFGNDKDRKYIALFPTLILSPILYFGIILLWMFSISYYPSNEFNKQEWEANHEERYKMSEDIIDSKMLIGKTKEEITRLLGQDFWAINENHIAYKLGTLPRLFNIDPDALNIYFENEKVIKVEQR